MPLTTSRKASKQRKTAAHAPDHRARKLVSSHLDGDLIVKYNRRSLPVVLGDTVRVMRGSYRGHTDKVVEVDIKHRRVMVEGVTHLQADGTKVPRPLDASAVMITKLNLADTRRREKLLASVSDTEKAKAREELEKQGEESAKEMEELRKREEEEREKRRQEREAEEAGGMPAPAAPERSMETAEIEAEPEEDETSEEDESSEEDAKEGADAEKSGDGEASGTASDEKSEEESADEEPPKGGGA